ncbi:hypothetical protein KAR91_61700 [Candidatus Pacearchaeota archaeon]|nr:hypothetical protein [Candidatus Pacearchaeota archaeon]
MGKNWRVKMGIDDGKSQSRPLEEQMYAQAIPSIALRTLNVLCHARNR